MTAVQASFRLDGVSVDYGGARPALRDVDLEIAPGERVGIVGPSGSGKTTLLRLLSATVRPSAGRVWVDGADLATLDPRGLRAARCGVGVVYQDLSLVPSLRALHNVLAGGLGRHGLLSSLRLMVRPPRAEVRRAHEILERVGVGEKLFQRTDRLSGGERQRVAIARALYQDPKALLADEPVSSVDPARARDTVALLVEIFRESGLTLLMSLHNLELAREFLPRLIGLRRGEIAFDRPTEELTTADFRRLYDLEVGPETAEPRADGAG
ncbi:MAG: phosphonate ABC transporter ATP-binding protein [Acidobacteriota bacterium]